MANQLNTTYPTDRSADYWFFSAVLVAVLTKLWLIEPQILVARWEYPHDDTLFIVNAFSILTGKWLGDYHQYTLIKGPFYPLWIAFSYYTGLSLRITGELLYTLASLTFVFAIWHLKFPRKWLYLLFLFIYLNPVSYNALIAYAFRWSIYFSLALLVFGSLLGLVISNTKNNRYAIVWSVLLGCVFTAFWHTREEGIWIMPSLFIMLSLSLILVFREHGIGKPLGKSILLTCVVPGTLFFSGTSILISINEHHYDVPHTVELKTQEFSRAHNALLSVKHNNWKRLYPVPKEALDRIFEVSEKARELKPYLESSGGISWSKGGPDIPAAYFVWAIRDAVGVAGYYAKGGKAVLQYYDDLGREIEDACERKVLECQQPLLPGIPPWNSSYNELVVPELTSTIKRVFNYKWFKQEPFSYSSGDRNFKEGVSIMNNGEILTRIETNSDAGFDQTLRRLKTYALSSFCWLYEKFIPPLFAISLLLLPCLIVLGPRNGGQLTLLTFGCSVLAGILAIIAILTLIKITSYPEIDRAMYTVQPLITLFISTMILALGKSLSTWRKHSPTVSDVA